jgi:hypothetical protein
MATEETCNVLEKSVFQWMTRCPRIALLKGKKDVLFELCR